MNKNLRNAIIIILGYLTFLINMAVFANFLHQALWGQSSIGDIFSIQLAASLGLLIVRTIGLYKNMKVKKLTFALLMITIYVSPVAMLGIYRYVDQQIYKSTYAFTVIKWTNPNEDDRAHMIRSLSKQYDLMGENIDVVPPLLGTPDSMTETAYYYNLGNDEYVLGIDPVFYLIELNDQNIIIAEGVYQR